MSAPSATNPLTARQLDLLRRMSELDPPPCVFGGYAEDALLVGTVTRTHLDVDWLLPRRELELRLAQARSLGFTEFETWGEAAPDEPFYLFAQNGDLSIDLGITDEVDGRHLVRIWKIAFEVDGHEAPAGYQFELPGDTYTHPPAQLDGIEVRVASPLALYQIRAGIAAKGSFGELPPASGRTSASCARRSSPAARRLSSSHGLSRSPRLKVRKPRRTRSCVTASAAVVGPEPPRYLAPRSTYDRCLPQTARSRFVSSRELRYTAR